MPIPGRGREFDIEPLNLTPLLDCILNLIFFFLVATTLKTEWQSMKVDLPQAANMPIATEEKEYLRVAFAADGRILLNEDTVTSAQLRARLEEMAKTQPEPLPVRLFGDAKSDFQTFIDVMEILRETGHLKSQVFLDKRKTP